MKHGKWPVIWWACLACLILPALLLGCRVLGQPQRAYRSGDEIDESQASPVPAEMVEPTATWTPAPTDTPIPPTPTPLPPTPTSSPSPTPTPATPMPTPTCAIIPQWGLGDVWQNPEVKERLGCATGEQIGAAGEEMYFQRGHMIWRPDNGLIYVLFTPYTPAGWGAFPDTSTVADGTPEATLPAPTTALGGPKLYEPTGRFGKLWRDNAWLQEKLGWAVLIAGTTAEDGLVHAFQGAVQDFEGGVLFWNGNVCFVLRLEDMSWTLY